MFVKKENMNITLKLRSVGCINTIIQLDYNFIQSIILNYGDNCTLITVFKKAAPRRRTTVRRLDFWKGDVVRRRLINRCLG